MKKNKNFLLYISSITFCCLLMLFFASNKIKAATTYSCVDKDNNELCTDTSTNFYYRLDTLTIDDSSITTLEIPSTYNDGVHGPANVEVLASNFIDTATNLSLTELVLPSQLETILTGAFNKIDSITNITIPLTVSNIEANIFQDGANITNLYLNHYNFTDLDKELLMDENAFTNVNIDKIICNSHDVYNYYVFDQNSVLKDAPVVTLVTYKFHVYESDSLNDILVSEKYYVGKNQVINKLPDDQELEGLNFLGWHYKNGNQYLKLTLDGSVYYTLYTTEYDIYPKFELQDLTFEINSLNRTGKDSLNEKYDGKDELINLSIKNLKHKLNGVNGFDYSSEWKHTINNETDIISDEDAISLSRVDETGEYECVITFKYFYNEYTYTKTASNKVNVEITKAPLYVTIEDVTKTYGEYIVDDDIKYTVNGLLGKDEVTSKYYNYTNSGNISVRTYTNDIKVIINSITNGDERISNYNILYSYGDYIVNCKVIEVYFDDIIEFEYGQDIVITNTYVDESVYGQYDVEVNVYFAKSPGVKIDTYTVIGVKSVDNSNYQVNFNQSKSVGKVIVNPKKVATYYTIDSLTYNGEEKALDVYYYEVNGAKRSLDYYITYDGELVDEIVDAGIYVINIDSLNSENYDFLDTSYRRLFFEINRANPTVTYSGSQRFTYSGEVIRPIVKIDNEEQQPIYTCKFGNLIGDYCKNSGTYGVEVTFPQTKNYNSYTTPYITLSIEKMTANLNPRTFTFYYGEDIEAKERLIINGEEVEVVYYTAASKGDALGSYSITGALIRDIHTGGDHNNYNATIAVADCEDKVKIVSRPVTIVYYNYENLVYDGKEKKIGAFAVDNISNQVVDTLDVKVVSDEGIIKDAKTYHLRAYFDNPYYYATNSNLLVLTINKAKYDLSNISFEDGEFTLDFSKHYLFINGKLPEGVSVKYTIDGEETNSLAFGTKKTVVATFVGDSINYEPIDAMQATIKIDMTWFFVSIGCLVGLIAIAVCLAYLYLEYRRVHPKKIKLKIKNVIRENLEEKRIADSVEEVLADEEAEIEELEDENDLISDSGTDKTFIEKIYAADSELKYYYSEVKNELLSYEGITHTVDRKYEVFYHGTRQIAKLSICNKVLKLYVNLDPDKYDKKEYNHLNMSKFDCHSRTPLRIDVNTAEKLRHARVFIRILRRKENLKAVTSFVKIDYEKFYTLKENIFPKLFKKMFNFNKKKK